MKPAPIHSISASLVTLSAATTTARRQRPERIQSSARAMADAVEAQAAFTWVLGPRAPMYSANWLWPIVRMRSRKRRSKAYGSFSRSASVSAIRREISERVRDSRVVSSSSSSCRFCARRLSNV
jgi:hypothetical protein